MFAILSCICTLCLAFCVLFALHTSTFRRRPVALQNSCRASAEPPTQCARNATPSQLISSHRTMRTETPPLSSAQLRSAQRALPSLVSYRFASHRQCVCTMWRARRSMKVEARRVASWRGLTVTSLHLISLHFTSPLLFSSLFFPLLFSSLFLRLT